MIKKYFYIIFLPILIILISTFIISILNYFNIISLKLNEIFLYLTSIISLFIGSFNYAKIKKQKALISGIIYFIFYFLVIIISNVINKSFTINTFIYILMLLLFSIFASIFGKNIKESKENT